MRCIGLIIGILVILAALGTAVIYSGVYNVSATYPDRASVEWILDTTKTRSVQRHAAGIKTPALTDPAMVRSGLAHYREICLECHGAPGVPTEDLAVGLNPKSPELVEEAGEWKPNELFWITKYGIRMTGMSAWGLTHSDDEIWAIVAFLQTLPTLSPAEYKSLSRQVPPTNTSH